MWNSSSKVSYRPIRWRLRARGSGSSLPPRAKRSIPSETRTKSRASVYFFSRTPIYQIFPTRKGFHFAQFLKYCENCPKCDAFFENFTCGFQKAISETFATIPSRIHSQKPVIHHMIESAVNIPNSKMVEIFARSLVPGWTAIGNEVFYLNNSKFNESYS